jgi:hypothetical protein
MKLLSIDDKTPFATENTQETARNVTWIVSSLWLRRFIASGTLARWIRAFYQI